MDTQKLLSYMRKCIQDYEMIAEGDKIAVGLSGGKDSLTLLHGMKHLQRFYPKHFELYAVYVNLGITEDTSLQDSMTTFCAELEVPFYEIKTDIYDIVFKEREEKNPCSLCAKLRKGALYTKLNELGINKVAYAHHKDDFIETSLMSLFIEGHYHCFPPVTNLDRSGITVIRPMLYIPEIEITSFSRRNNFPVHANPCPKDGYSKRQQMKEFIEKAEEEFPNLKKNLANSLNEYFKDNK